MPTPTRPTSCACGRSSARSIRRRSSRSPARSGPSTATMIAIVSVGTGGGSIAWIGLEGGLHVGPRSAGAAPGPMAYDRGGDQPTVTDAHLVVGRLPSTLAGGEVRLRRGLSERGLDQIAG